MKGGKDEDKVMGPLFPRLHINDTEKGGPKAPPRNKMALYEQLSIPTQRFSTGSSLPLPLPHKTTSNLVPSASSNHHVKTSPYNLLGNTTAPHLAERLHSHTSLGAVLNTSSKNRAGQVKVTTEKDLGKFSIASHCSYFQPQRFSNSKTTSTKRLRDEDNCRVPAFLNLENALKSVDDPRERDSFDSIRISGNHRSTSDLFSKHHMSSERTIKKPLSCERSSQKPTSELRNEDEVLEKRDSHILHQKYILLQKTRETPDENFEKSNDCTLEGESCFKPSSRTEDQSHSTECGDLPLVEAENNAEITKICDIDSVSGARISPDAVVEAIGQKQFWKTRRAMVHQQKVFAVQLFELHKLIKVQKLFAESPDILMEDKFFLGKPPIDKLPEKRLRLDAPEPTPKIHQPKDDHQIPNLIADTNKGLNNLLANYKPYYSATDVKPSPLCFPTPPPGNQWLVPMMSPSEGLIYKPFTGPCPPTTTFPGPVQNGPMSLTTPAREEYLRFGFFPPYTSSFNSFCLKNLVESKESEIHGSTASSPDIKLRENALPFFPTAPTDKSEKTQTSANCTRVIKVVPHNAKSASESAARIFRSIQEERRQLDLS